jgi:type IV pilus assembly protein PilM
MKLFKHTSIGLDIADNSIEVVKLNKSGQKIIVESTSRVNLDGGIVVNGKVVDEKKLSESLKLLFSSAKPSLIEPEDIVFGLPESQVYTHLFSLPEHKKEDREDLILKEAEAGIPIESNDLLYSYKIIESTKSKKDKADRQDVEVLLVATSTAVALKWQEFFKNIGIEVKSFDIETLASFRSLFQRTPSGPVCVVDLGARKTNVSIFDENSLRSSYSTFIAGDNITEQIASSLSISTEEAEKKKLSADLSQAENDVSGVIKNTLAPLVKEIKNTLLGFQSINKVGVKEIILIGGLSQMKGLPTYLSNQLAIPAKIGVAAWLDQKVPLVYIEAIGLALRGLQKKWDNRDPEIPIPDIEEIKKKKAKDLKKKEKIETLQTDESQELHLTDDRVKTGKLKKQKITLLVILVLGVLLVGSLFWYRSNSREQRSLESESKLVSYLETQTFNLEIPVAVVADQYTADRVKGRIVVDEVTLSGSYNEALQNSFRKIKDKVAEEEKVWEEPLDKIADTESVEFPIEFKWFIYNEPETNALFLKEIDKINTDNIDFELNNIIKTGVKETDNPDIFLLKGDITLSLNQFFDIESIENEPEENDAEPTAPVSTVIILDTPIGVLNVRSGPGTSFSKISEISPGDEFEVLQKENDWVKIKISEDLQGWVITQYVKEN